MIQKRVRVVLMIVVIAFLLTACRSTGKPDNVSDPAYNAGLRAIQIADNYLDYKITREEAKEQMDEKLGLSKDESAEEPDEPSLEPKITLMGCLKFGFNDNKDIELTGAEDHILGRRETLRPPH